LTTLPVLHSFRVKFPELALPAYLDDMTIMAADAADPAAAQRVLAAFQHVGDGLRAVGVPVNTRKSVCLLPACDDRPPPPAAAVGAAGCGCARCASLQARLGVPTRCDGITLMGVPVGAPAFVRASSASALRTEATDRLLSELAGMEDAQVAFALLRLCDPARATFLARNVGLPLLGDELRRYDALLVCTLAAVLQEPPVHAPPPLHGGHTATPGDGRATQWQLAVAAVRAADWDGTAPVELSAAQRMQAQLRQRHGGLGITSSLHRAPAAFLGRTVEVLRVALRALPAVHTERLRADGGARLLATATLVHARACVCGSCVGRLLQCGPAAVMHIGAAGSTLRLGHDGTERAAVRF